MGKLTGPKLLVGDADTCPDLEYVIGFRATDPVVALVDRSKRYLVVPDLELGRATREARRCRIYTPGQLGLRGAERRMAHEWTAALLRSLKIRTAWVAPDFPLQVARRLEKQRIRVVVGGVLFPQRAVKTEREVACLRQSQRAAVKAMKHAISVVRRSRIQRDGTLSWRRKTLTSERLHLEIRRVLLDENCSAPMIIAAGGAQGADPHEVGHGPLRGNEPIVIDIFPRHNAHGYWGDITRTVVKGRPTEEARRMYRAVNAAQRKALQMVRPGIDAAKIHTAVAGVFDDRGFATGEADGTMFGFFHGTGHGVGLEIHEAPNVARTTVRLRAGHVITIEPGLYYPETGGVRIEDTVVVTKDGCRALASCSKQFVV